MDGRVGGGVLDAPYDENSSEICLLLEVQRIWDIGSIMISGPRFLGAGHGSDAYAEGF